MREYVAFMTLVLVGLVGCSTSEPERTDFTLEELGERLVRTVCPGAPTKSEPVPNQHMPGQIDRLETRECAAGSATLYVGDTTSDPRGLAVAVEIGVAGTGLPSHLEVGQPIETTLQVLGLPESRTPGSITYALGLEGNGTVTIRHMAGKISSVQWAWNVD